jgi:hypothetical protein
MLSVWSFMNWQWSHLGPSDVSMPGQNENVCMFGRRQPLLAASQQAVVHDSCPSLLASWSLTSDLPLSRCAAVGAGWRCW